MTPTSTSEIVGNADRFDITLGDRKGYAIFTEAEPIPEGAIAFYLPDLHQLRLGIKTVAEI